MAGKANRKAALVTEMPDPYMDDPQVEKCREGQAATARPGNPEEVAEALLFPAANDAEFVSGDGLDVGGAAIAAF